MSSSYDKWIPDTQNLYRVEMTARMPDRPPLVMAVIPFAMPEAMLNEIPGVTAMTRVFMNPMTLTAGDRQFRETCRLGRSRFLQADPSAADRGRSGHRVSPAAIRW